MRIITNGFEETSIMMIKDQKGTLQECLELLTFLNDFDDNLADPLIDDSINAPKCIVFHRKYNNSDISTRLMIW